MRKEQPKINVESKHEAIEIVSECGAKLRRLDSIWKKDKDVVLSAVKSFPFALSYADKKLRDDLEIVLEAIKREPRTLTEASNRISENDSIRAYAFEINGSPFIVNKAAMTEFQFWDSKLIASCTKFIKQGYGEEDKMICDESKMLKSEFYHIFIKYYQGDDLTAQDIKNYERWLLKQKKLRVASSNKYSEI